MQIIPQNPFNWVSKHDNLVCRYLAEHEREWRSLTGFRRWIARLRLEHRAWKYARENLKWDKHNARNLY